MTQNYEGIIHAISQSKEKMKEKEIKKYLHIYINLALDQIVFEYEEKARPQEDNLIPLSEQIQIS